MNILHKLILTTFIFISANALYSQDYKFRDVTTGLDTPWEILWGPDGNIWMTERYGRISRVNPETGEIKELAVINDVFEEGEHGLLGMALHPEFEHNPWVFVVYTYKGGSSGVAEKLVRFNYNGDKLYDPQILLDNIPGYWNHDGSRLWITGDSKLFMTTGDAAQNPATALNPESLNGKILRMNLDGTIPDDNPIKGSYVWSLGHRNPQGLVEANGIMYSSEHGPSTDDELNIITKGGNYGWPEVKGYCDKTNEMSYCENNKVIEPIISLFPNSTIAACGIDYYNNDLFPEWKNSILLTALKNASLYVIKLNDVGKKVVSWERFFAEKFGRLRDLCISPDGRVFIATSNLDGRGNPWPDDDRIIEITPKTNGVEKKNREIKFSVSPNPSGNYFNFLVDDPEFSQAEIKITDNLGLSVFDINLNGNGETFWNGSRADGRKSAPGTYFAILKSRRNRSIKKLILLP